MTQRFLEYWLLSAFIGTLAACDRHETPASPRPAPVVEGDRIVLPPEAGIIETQPVAQRVGGKLSLPGRLVWNEERTARLFPPFSGRVKEILAKPGDRVTVGQPLAMIEAPEFGIAQTEFRKAEAALNLANRHVDRVRSLFQHGITSRKEMDQAQTDLAQAQSEAERASARLSAYGLSARAVDERFPLKSPIAGIVVERALNPGQEVDAAHNQALFVVSDPTNFWAILEVPEKELADVRVGNPFLLSVRAYPLERFSGTITHVSDFIDPKARTVKVRGAIADPTRRLKAEMFVTAELNVHGGSAVQIPEQAAVLVGDTFYVFVAEGDHTYRRRAIETRAADRGEIPVLAGLAPGEQVVVHGALFLQQLLQSAHNRR